MDSPFTPGRSGRSIRVIPSFLYLSAALTIASSVAGEPALANDWHPSSGTVEADFSLSDIPVREGNAPGVKRWAVPKQILFRGRVVTRYWRTDSDGTMVRYKTGWAGGKRLLLVREGTPYLTQVPRFTWDAISWRSVNFRRPTPIQGSLRVKYDIFEKTTGRPGQWDCSVYYRDVCRWLPRRPAVPKHRVGGASSKGFIFTHVGRDENGSPLFLGNWTRPLDEIPSQISQNPGYPIWNKGTAMYGQGPLENDVDVEWKRDLHYTN